MVAGVVLPATRAVAEAPVTQPPRREPTAADVAGAPLPGEETGRLDSPGGDSVLRDTGLVHQLSDGDDYVRYGGDIQYHLGLGVGPRGVGMLETDLYDPGTWKSSTPGYVPMYLADRIDNFWAAKIIMRFTRDQIRAAVDAGRLTNPRAAAWLTDTLIARQRRTAAYWFARVAPLDEPAIDATGTLCFKDLSIVYAFAPAATTHYTLALHDRHGTRRSAVRFAAGTSGVTCVRTTLADDRDGYTIARIVTRRPDFVGATDVHIARDPISHVPRVIGIWRL